MHSIVDKTQQESKELGSPDDANHSVEVASSYWELTTKSVAHVDFSIVVFLFKEDYTAARQDSSFNQEDAVKKDLSYQGGLVKCLVIILVKFLVIIILKFLVMIMVKFLVIILVKFLVMIVVKFLVIILMKFLVNFFPEELGIIVVVVGI